LKHGKVRREPLLDVIDFRDIHEKYAQSDFCGFTPLVRPFPHIDLRKFTGQRRLCRERRSAADCGEKRRTRKNASENQKTESHAVSCPSTLIAALFGSTCSEFDWKHS
jgi:hypothetical protein